MSYFLKQTKVKNRIYLQISETTYNKETKTSSNKCYEKIGFLDDLKEDGLEDPIAFYKEKIKDLNDELKVKQTTKRTLNIKDRKIENAGLFLPKGILNSLDLKSDFDSYAKTKNVDFDFYNTIEVLILNKILDRQFSISKTPDVFDFPFKDLGQFKKDALKCLDFLGENYLDILNIFQKRCNDFSKPSTSYLFFDSTKMFFDINGKSECVEQCITLNDEFIPNGFLMIKADSPMKSYRKEAIAELKKRYPSASIIRVADKGINYGNNIHTALLNKEGYIFPLSLSLLEDNEKEWILNKHDYSSITNSRGETLYEVKAVSGEYFIKVNKADGSPALIKAKQRRIASFDPFLSEKKRKSIHELVDQARTLFYSKARKQDYGKALKYIKITKQEDKFEISIDKIKNELRYAGYKLIVTSEEDIRKKDVFYVYDTMWKTEDYFRRSKQQLDEDKEYTKSIERIFGFFVIDYMVITLFRFLEEKIFNRDITAEEVATFIREFNVMVVGNEHINLLSRSTYQEKIQNILGIKIDKQYFTDSDIKLLKNIKIL